MVNKRGFILVTILLFLHIFTLLSVFALMRVTSSMKQNAHRILFYRFRAKVERTMQEIVKRKNICGLTCRIRAISACKLSKKPLRWWKRKGCQVMTEDHDKYYYVIESIGNDICAQIKELNMIAHYYRITLFAETGKLKNARYILQNTLISPENSALLCKGYQRTVSQGIQMQREI